MSDPQQGKSKVEQLPGYDVDEPGTIEDHINKGKVLIGILATGSIGGFLLKQFGLMNFPLNPQTNDYARGIAFVMCCVNILAWMYFPLADMNVLRKWVRTIRKTIVSQTAEFLAIIGTAVVLLSFIVSSLVGPFWFGMVGTVVYVYNFLGFACIRRQVAEAVSEAGALYVNDARKEMLLKALNAVRQHWGCREEDGAFLNKQQIRHLLLAVSFALVAAIGKLSEVYSSSILQTAAYALGIFTIIMAEISIAIWRVQRDHALRSAAEELRYFAWTKTSAAAAIQSP